MATKEAASVDGNGLQCTREVARGESWGQRKPPAHTGDSLERHLCAKTTSGAHESEREATIVDKTKKLRADARSFVPEAGLEPAHL